MTGRGVPTVTMTWTRLGERQNTLGHHRQEGRGRCDRLKQDASWVWAPLQDPEQGGHSTRSRHVLDLRLRATGVRAGGETRHRVAPYPSSSGRRLANRKGSVSPVAAVLLRWGPTAPPCTPLALGHTWVGRGALSTLSWDLPAGGLPSLICPPANLPAGTRGFPLAQHPPLPGTPPNWMA